jgi:hypothetical protein
VAERAGFEPAVPLTKYDSLANCWFQPLTHLSGLTEINLKVCIYTPFQNVDANIGQFLF